jgi:ATP-dependent protease ClpP protease subunit
MHTIRLFNDITEQTLTQLTKELDRYETGSDLTIQVCSCGGYVFYAFGIIDYIKARKFKTTAEVLGMAASAAALIVLACDRVKMAEYGSIMIHSAYNDDDSQDAGIMRANELQLQIINRRCKEITLETLSKDQWFSAKQALKLGLADEFITDADSIMAICNHYLASIKGEVKMDDEKKVCNEVNEEVKADEMEAAPSMEELVSKMLDRLEAIEHRLAVLEGEGKKEDDELVEEKGDGAVYAKRKALYARLTATPAPVQVQPKATAKRSKINLKNFVD